MIIKMIMSNAATHTMLKVKIAVSFPVPVKVLQYQYDSDYFDATFAVSLSINVK